MSVLGQAALDVAIDQVGLGEVGRNNCGPHVQRWCGREGAFWCAGFVSWCLREGALRLRVTAPKYSTGARRLGQYLLEYAGAKEIRRENDLWIGDIVIYSRPPSKTNGHTGIVLLRNAHGYVTIEGNVGGFPAIVGPEYHKYGGERFLYGVRLP